jgi:hypothetical protein
MSFPVQTEADSAIEKDKRILIMSVLPAFAAALKNRRKSQQPQVKQQSAHTPTDSDADPPLRQLDQNMVNEWDDDQKRLKADPPRHSLPVQRCSQLVEDDDDPLIDFSPVRPKATVPPQSLSELPEEMTPVPQEFSESPGADEVGRLEQLNTDLLGKCRDLEQQLRSLQHKNRDLMSEISGLKAESYKTAQLTKELGCAEQEIENLNQLIRSKDANFASLDRDYKTLENDYKRRRELRTAENESLRLKQLEINRLQKELDEYRSLSRSDDNAYGPALRASRLRHNLDDEPLGTTSRFQRDESNEPASIPRRSYGQVHVAMRDNVKFGDDHPPRIRLDIQVEDLSDTEIRSRLMQLTLEKEEKERKICKAAPRGANMVHVNRQKEEMEEEIAELSRQISKYRFEMKRRDIY